jgi:thymidylate synthase
VIVINGSNNTQAILKLYQTVLCQPEVEIRGQKCRNALNLAIEMDGRVAPITSFVARGLNLTYCKKEWLWYLGADPKDDSIEQYAKMWAKLKQPDGSYFSNYGQYIFAKNADGESQFSYVIKTLKADPHSRRASIVLLKRDHLFQDNTDTVCTYAINFTIQSNHLHMTVMMRSNDVVYGFTNDAFCFWSLMEFVYQVLSASMPDLRRGGYTHFANSMHVYERHYKMLRDIVDHSSGNGNFYKVNVPRPTPQEVIQLVNSGGKEGQGEYTSWLKAE